MIKEYNESVRWMERRYSICSFCCAFFGHQFLFSCNVSVFVRMAVKKRRIYFMYHISFYSYRIYLLQAILRFLSSENFSTFTLFLLRHALVFLWIDCHIESIPKKSEIPMVNRCVPWNERGWNYYHTQD